MKLGTSQIRLGIVVVAVVIFAMGYRAIAARVTQPSSPIITLPAPVSGSVISQ
jgi:hypothetical protein